MPNKNSIMGVLIVITTVLLNACGEDNSQFIGTWVSDSGQGSIEFSSNDEVVVIDNMNLKVTGTYTIENNYQILFHLTGTDIFDKQSKNLSTYSVRANYEIKGDKLKLIVEDEQEVLDYRRH